MSHWNYRVIEFATTVLDPARRELREVYYNAAGEAIAYGQVVHVAWDVEEGDAVPVQILARMREALDKPVLYDKNFVAGHSQPSPRATQYAATFEEDSETGDLMLLFPEEFLAAEDWRTGDRLIFDNVSHGEFRLINLSKKEREEEIHMEKVSTTGLPVDTASDDRMDFGHGSQFDAGKLLEFLDLGNADLPHIPSTDLSSSRQDAAPPSGVQKSLEAIADTVHLVARHFYGDPQKTAVWFKARNPLLGDVSPSDMIRLGRHASLHRFVLHAVGGEVRPSSMM